MAATILSQLEASVANVQQEFRSLGRPLMDDNESVSDFCLLMERVLNFQAKKNMLGEKRDYWAYFLASLEKSSFQPLLKRIQSGSDNKTTVGKGRSFIRACLVGKSLGSVLQEALQRKRVAEQFYHHESILRHEPFAMRMLDQVYHLTEVDFKLDEHLCVDDGWPTFQSKDFSAVPERRPRGDDEMSFGLPADSQSSAVARSVDGPASDAGSMPVDLAVSTELERLRTERNLLIKERDDAIKEKQDSDSVWTTTVSSLKDKAVALREKLATCERQLAAEKERAEKAEALLKVDQMQLEAAKARVAELQEPKAEAQVSPAEHTSEVSPAAVENIHQQVEAEVENKYQQRLEEVAVRAREAEERLRIAVEEHSEARSELLGQIAEREKQIEAEQATVASLQQMRATDEAEMAALRESHALTVSELKQIHNQSVRAQEDHIDGLSQQLGAAAKEKAALVAEIEALRAQLAAEAERTAAAEKLVAQLHSAVLKATDQDKFTLWTKADELSEFADQIATTATSTWEDDSKVSNCNQCGAEFSLLRRRHHCRVCGRIFCDPCSSNMVQVSSSRKPERSCGSCCLLLPKMKNRTKSESGKDVRDD